MDRQAALEQFADEFEDLIWAVFSELEKTLVGLIEVTHFNSSDPASVGNTLHGALEAAAIAAGVDENGLSVVWHREGPCFKLEGLVGKGATSRRFSAELHLSGPKGGTGKSKHQFASVGSEDQPELPGMETDAPEMLLIFLGYHLSASATKVSRLFAIYADGVDRKKVELIRPANVKTGGDVSRGADTGPDIGAKLSLKGRVSGEKETNGLENTKRSDAAPGQKEA